MENKATLYLIIGFLAGCLLTMLFTSNVINNNQSMMGMRTSNQMNSNSMDAHFIEQMIPHHEDAITMAKLAQTRSQRPEIKQLADNIITSQGQEINQMQDWYKSWFGKDVPINTETMNHHGMMGSGGMHMGMMGDETDIKRLEQAQDFDKVFIEEMIPHHQMAVMMANMLKSGTQRPEMMQLSDNIINAQTKEINEMRQWYNNWGY